MKVICDRGALLDAVNLVSGVVASRSPRPQLTCVKLEAVNEDGVGQLTLAATDAEISIRLRTAAVDVQQPGSALVPADKLRQIVSAEDADPTLTLSVDGDLCEIRGADASFKLHGYPPEDFPPVPGFADAVKAGGHARAIITHGAGRIAEMVARTLFATARENSRYAINGVLLKREGKKLELVATDGRRLALARDKVAGSKDDGPVSCIIPAKALSLLMRLIDDPDQEIRLVVTDNQILFAVGPEDDTSAVLVSNLVEGTFPPYDEVIPKDSDKEVKFDKDVLASAVRRAALLTNEESRGVRMAFKGGERQLELTSRAPEMGEAHVTVDLAAYSGEDIEIGFNPAFLTDALKVITDPEVILELKAPNKPGLVKSGSDFLYVVMPVNLQ